MSSRKSETFLALSCSSNFRKPLVLNVSNRGYLSRTESDGGNMHSHVCGSVEDRDGLHYHGSGDRKGDGAVQGIGWRQEVIISGSFVSTVALNPEASAM